MIEFGQFQEANENLECNELNIFNRLVKLVRFSVHFASRKVKLTLNSIDKRFYFTFKSLNLKSYFSSKNNIISYMHACISIIKIVLIGPCVKNNSQKFIFFYFFITCRNKTGLLKINNFFIASLFYFFYVN
jgi:hypothetical protein